MIGPILKTLEHYKHWPLIWKTSFFGGRFNFANNQVSLRINHGENSRWPSWVKHSFGKTKVSWRFLILCDLLTSPQEWQHHWYWFAHRVMLRGTHSLTCLHWWRFNKICLICKVRLKAWWFLKMHMTHFGIVPWAGTEC